jgi:ABC-type glycerol-3-phosphate transport system permease component
VRKRTSAGSVLAAILGIAWALVVLAPIYFLVLGSLRNQADYLTASPWIPTGGITLGSFQTAMSGVGVAVRNSVIVTVAVCALVIVVSVPAAYALVRGRSRSLRTMYGLFLVGLAVPLEGTVVSVFVLVVKFHLYDTLVGIILPSAAFSISISILILVAFLRDIPRSLFEAMDIDGAGQLRVLWSLVFPLARPPLLGLGVFVILGTWNSLLLPLVTTTSNSEAVLPVALLRLQSSDSANYPAIMASVIISAIPIVVLYIAGRRQLINGLVISTGGAGR